jgi:hypothetical protein
MKGIVCSAVGLGLMIAGGIAAPAMAQTQSTTSSASNSGRASSPGLAALHERQKKCGAEWRAAKSTGKIETGMTWPKYWSACNKRLKGGQ